MNTKIVKDTDDAGIAELGEIIRKGGIVAFPTETVYGLGANAYDDNAVKKIYTAKGRPSDNPLIVHICDVSDVSKVAREIPENAKKLFSAFAPGPFTLILKKQKNISDTVTAGLDTVGVRIPSDKTARRFIKAAGVPIAAPSANLSGKPSPTNAERVISDMNGRADGILCGGDSKVGVESTIIDCTGDVPMILRPGGITKEDIKKVCGDVLVDAHVLSSVSEGEKPKCPGMKYRHYAPDADVTVVEGDVESTAKKIIKLCGEDRKNGLKTGILAFSDLKEYSDFYIFEGEDNRAFAGLLFESLRSFDDLGAEKVYVQLCHEDEYSLAVKNRVYKSAGNKIIYTGETK